MVGICSMTCKSRVSSTRDLTRSKVTDKQKKEAEREAEGGSDNQRMRFQFIVFKRPKPMVIRHKSDRLAEVNTGREASTGDM